MLDSIEKFIMDFLYVAEFAENKKINTVSSFKKDLAQFNNYLKTKEKIEEITKITPIIIRGFLLFLQSNKVTKRSINRKLSSLRGFFKYLIKSNIIKINPVEKISSFSFDTDDPDILTIDEVNRLRAVIDESSINGLRDRLILELLYSTGITATEMLLIGENMFNLNIRELKVYNGKSNRTVFFSNKTKEYYIKYIEEKKKYYKEKYSANIVFINGSGTRLSDRSLRRLIDRYADRAEFTREISPYSFRHTFAVYMLTHGMPVNYLKTLMGHITVESTMIYENLIFKKGLKNE
ncbi:MAG: tyrosine-type recombinase/integrase [Fusobacteriaceae bacterium]|jgi:integrase/recombinase XerD|nr:tyrosine-type recombinase/integrase [Fusobacteriaceae bacterium]